MIKRYSVQQLNWISRKMNIWCIGCGKRFNEMISTYQKEAFTKKISKLIDNNEALWGKEKEINGKIIKICGSEIVRQEGNRSVILIITSDHSDEIYCKLEKIIEEQKMKCVLYPDTYFFYSRYVMCFVSAFPIRRQMIFRAGVEPHENADEIVRYLRQEYNGKPYKISYLVEESKATEKCNGIEYLDRNVLRRKAPFTKVLRYCFSYGRAAYLFYENEVIRKVRKEQRIIYLNHGTIPLKYVADVLQQPKGIDYAVCPSKSCAQLYVEQYGIPKTKHIYMMPPRVRNIFHIDKERIDSLFGSAGKQVILWLPTFRRLEGTDREDFSMDYFFEEIISEEGLSIVEKILKKNNQILIIKEHPREKNKVVFRDNNKSIILISDTFLSGYEISLQNILGRADALISDYSGVTFEYMLLDRPLGYIIGNIHDYNRGFSVENPLDYMPGEKIRNFKELSLFFDSIKNNTDAFREDRRKLVKELFGDTKPEEGAKILLEFLRERG